MKPLLIFMLFTAGHANQTPTLQRKTRAQSSLKVGSVVIENQTNELLKVFIEAWDRSSIIELNSYVTEPSGRIRYTVYRPVTRAVRVQITLTLSNKHGNFYPIKPKMLLAKTELRETNSTKNQYSNHEFQSGFTTILPMQIREVEFIFHQVDISGLVLCTIFNGDNIKMIDREIMKNQRSYQFYQFNHFYIIQPAG